MHSILSRRRFGLSLAATAAAAWLRPASGFAAPAKGLPEAFADIEATIRCRLGVSIVDTESGRRWAHRADERFPMCSTFKMLAAAAVLARVDAGREDLGRRIPVTADDIVAHAPVTEKRVGGEPMSLAELCEATVTLSDNPAANLILRTLGGPGGITAYARTLGDDVTRLDRWETALNEAAPRDPRDTTTPDAMAGNLRILATGEALSPASRDILLGWLIGCRTGDAKLRAGLPEGWRVGDKTGGGGHGTNNDVGIIWPPGRRPVIAAVYVTESEASFADRNAAIAHVARALAETLREG